jgi:hypothetical protein
MLRYLGPIFALANLSILPLVWTMISISFSGMFAKGPVTPHPLKPWLPVLSLLMLAAVALIPPQAMLATLCLTWSTGAFWRRLLTHWLIVLAAFGAFLCGIPLYWLGSIGHGLLNGKYDSLFSDLSGSPKLDYQYWREFQFMLAYLSSLPMVLLGAQLPFWVLRCFTGYRLERLGPAGESGTEPKRPLPADALSIKDIMLATALIAVSLALLQFSDRVFHVPGTAPRQLLFAMLIVTAVTVLVSFLAGLPLALLFLGRLSLADAWGISLAYAGLGSLLVFAADLYFAPGANQPEQFGYICLLVYVGVVAYAAGLTMLRQSGWRLAGRARSVRDG